MEILFVILFIVVWLIARWRDSPREKGDAGERIVQRYTSRHLNSAVYRRIDNITLERHGQTTQIDHVIVSPFGIFVVETKNMSGWIFGSADQARWTQTLFRTTNRFQNPLRQNYRHVKALAGLLAIPAAELQSVVVFVGDAEFKTPMPVNVTDESGMVAYIQSFTTELFSTAEVERLVGKIEQAKLPVSKETSRKHLESLRRRALPAAPGQPCPWCGSTLVLRTASNGAQSGNRFLGCSGYPECRYTGATSHALAS